MAFKPKKQSSKTLMKVLFSNEEYKSSASSEDLDEQDISDIDEIVHVFNKGTNVMIPEKQYTMMSVPGRLGVKINRDDCYYDDQAEQNYKVKRNKLLKHVKM